MEFTVDWVVAIGMFFLLIVWAFAFYTQLFENKEDISVALEGITDRVLDNLTVQVYSVPLYVNYSSVPVANVFVYADYIWPLGRNSSRVYRGNTEIANCNFSTNRINFRTNLAAQKTVFTLRYTNNNASTECNQLPFANLTYVRAIPQAVQIADAISWANLVVMNATPLAQFKTFLGVNRDFNITVESNNTVLLSYGRVSPSFSSVYSKTILGVLEETNQNVTLRFLTW